MKRISLSAIISLAGLFSNLSYANVSFLTWFDDQTKEYSEGLHKENASLTDQDVERATQRANALLVEKKWTEAIPELTRLIGRHPNKKEFWISLSLALQAKNKIDNHWKTLQESRIAAYKAYLLSKTKEEQAEALLV
jgi:DNA-binding SARP family transcriptional activator